LHFSRTSPAGKKAFATTIVLTARHTCPFLSAGFFVTLIVTLLVVGCAVPGDPMPPLLELPEPVSDLSARQVGSKILVRFTWPVLTTEGMRIRKLARVELHALSNQDGFDSNDFYAHSELLATWSAAEVSRSSEPFVHEVSIDPARLDRRWHFAIKAINLRGKDAGFSNVESLYVIDLPSFPYGLAASLSERTITLSWQSSPRSPISDAKLSPEGYEIFRSQTGAPFSSEPITIVESTEYEDGSFQFGQSYIYQVRAYRQREGSRAVTQLSESTEITATDIFPPVSPQNIRAIAVTRAVELSWSPNTDDDLSGYNVYRSEGTEFLKLNKQLLSIPLFRDTHSQPGTEYRYRVRALDRVGNESDSSETVEVTAE
jgi:hypothetical protein